MGTAGSDLLQQIMNGDAEERTSVAAEKVRTLVVPALHELIDQGARVRPALLKGKHVGFVRGVHGSERSLVFRWYPDADERVLQIVAHGSTLTRDEILSLSGTELRNLLRQINAITESDFSLYPYISAFTTTSISEMLWFGRGATVATWSRNKIEIPGGWALNLLAPPEHATLWAGVAALRERSKKRLDETFNAAMITRAMVGRGADQLYQSLKRTQKDLASDSIKPWTRLVPPDVAGVDLKDGWGHAFSDDSREGLLRELTGMENDDRHEKVMRAFYDQQMEAARRQEDEIEQTYSQASDEIEDVATILTSAQVRSMNASLREQADLRAMVVRQGMEEASEAIERRERRAEGRYEPTSL